MNGIDLILMKRKAGFSVMMLTLLMANLALADSAGKPIVTPTGCDGDTSKLSFVCDALEATLGFGLCKVTSNTCVQGEQEIFTGLTIELASPTNIKPWTGFGGMGEIYQLSHLCLLRDLKGAPLQAEAEASTPIGKVQSKGQVSLTSLDMTGREFTGYQRLKVCAPAVGCLDGITQKFSLKGVKTTLKGSGQKVGGYDIYDSFALDLHTEGFAQGLQVNIPAIDVYTPYGKVSATPNFGFGKAVGYILAPYDGNLFSTVNGTLGAAKMTDLYGRDPGAKYSQIFPVKVVTSDRIIDNSVIGWISQVGMGGRDSNPKTTAWSAGATPYPLRPDLDLTTARSGMEKGPNFNMGANVKVAYSPTDLLPSAIKDSSFISISFEVWAKPLVETFFSTQFHQYHSEVAKWSGKMGDYTPFQLNQAKTLFLGQSASAAARFALDAGVDLNLHLHVPLPWPLDDINLDLIDIHPQTTVLEKVDAQSKKGPRESQLFSQADKVLTEKKFFQTFNTFNGAKDSQSYLTACLQTPKVTGEEPKDPVYTPGNPTDLTKGILYPCNICVGMNDYTYKDEKSVEHTIKGFLQTLFPADFNTKPAAVKWTCSNVIESGCYDMCSYDVSTGKLTVVETAREMIAAGKTKKMSLRCQ